MRTQTPNRSLDVTSGATCSRESGFPPRRRFLGGALDTGAHGAEQTATGQHKRQRRTQ